MVLQYRLLAILVKVHIYSLELHSAKKYSSKEDKSYTYSDLQIAYFGYGGFWGGAGYGIAFMDGKKLKRSKYFGGYLLAGYTKENIKMPESGWQNNTFAGYHLGLALPIIGYHFHP